MTLRRHHRTLKVFLCGAVLFAGINVFIFHGTVRRKIHESEDTNSVGSSAAGKDPTERMKSRPSPFDLPAFKLGLHLEYNLRNPKPKQRQPKPKDESNQGELLQQKGQNGESGLLVQALLKRVSQLQQAETGKIKQSEPKMIIEALPNNAVQQQPPQQQEQELLSQEQQSRILRQLSMPVNIDPLGMQQVLRRQIAQNEAEILRQLFLQQEQQQQ